MCISFAYFLYITGSFVQPVGDNLFIPDTFLSSRNSQNTFKYLYIGSLIWRPPFDAGWVLPKGDSAMYPMDELPSFFWVIPDLVFAHECIVEKTLERANNTLNNTFHTITVMWHLLIEGVYFELTIQYLLVYLYNSNAETCHGGCCKVKSDLLCLQHLRCLGICCNLHVLCVHTHPQEIRGQITRHHLK